MQSLSVTFFLVICSTKMTRGEAGYESMATYLAKYGYLSPSFKSIRSSIGRLQAFAGLEQTGEMDGDTEEIMKMKRCGVKDIQEDEEGDMEKNVRGLKRVKRFILQGSRWNSRTKTKTMQGLWLHLLICFL